MFCDKCDGVMEGDSGHFWFRCVKCHWVKPYSLDYMDDNTFLKNLAILIQREKEEQEVEPFRAEVVSKSQSSVTIRLPFSTFDEGEMLAYSKGSKWRYLGTVVLKGEFTTVLSDVLALSDLSEGESICVARAETSVGYDLQLELIKKLLSGLEDSGPLVNAYLGVARGNSVALRRRAQEDARLDLSQVDDSPHRVSPVPSGLGLDSSQGEVYSRALSLREGELLVVVGPPGTGKTKVISEIAKSFAERGFRVLVASHTNRAVDNVVERLPLDYTLRVGLPEKVLLELKKYLLMYRAKEALGEHYHQLEAERGKIKERLTKLLRDKRELSGLYEESKKLHGDKILLDKIQKLGFEIGGLQDELSRVSEEIDRLLLEESMKLISEARVVGSTLIKCGLSPLDRFNDFDLVIVDEASQAPLTLALIALSKGKRWIIVGDDKQLLPIFKTLYSEDTGEYGYVKAVLNELSVFSVALKHSKVKFMLTNHYRSHPEIFGFSSREFYGGRVSVVSDPVGKTLEVRGFGLFSAKPAAVFVHVKGCAEFSKPSYKNQAEVDACVEIVRRLTMLGVLQEDVCVIAPYRLQRNLIGEVLTNSGIGKVEVNTVDAFQGREKKVVVFSVTATDPRTLKFVSDPNRFNVAVTRAQCKLIVVGNAEAIMCEDSPIKHFLEYAKSINGYFEWENVS